MSARQNTAGSSHKPAVIWSFTTGFNLAPIIFFFFKLITGSEDTSLSVLTKPAVMMPTVMSKSGVVNSRDHLPIANIISMITWTIVNKEFIEQ